MHLKLKYITLLVLVSLVLSSIYCFYHASSALTVDETVGEGGTTYHVKIETPQLKRPITKNKTPPPGFLDILVHDADNVNWKPNGPWDVPPPGLYRDDETGSKLNCTQSFTAISDATVPERADGGEIMISCHTVRYRAPKAKIRNAGPLLVGVLSAAVGKGPNRRQYIRSTWANDFTGAFFIVAGPWEDIEKEFMFYQDMIWIDEEEVYEGENSVLTYKSIAYLTLVQMFAKEVKDGGLQHALKTDDDTYVNIGELRKKLIDIPEKDNMHYYGHCPQYHLAPLRDRNLKWKVTYETYPEPMFPMYCQGAGYGVSRAMLDCAVNNRHVSDFRYIPFEDVSIGILAERCGYASTMIKGVKDFRADTEKERSCVRQNIPMTKCYENDPDWPPTPHMKGKLIQHRVETQEDMIGMHDSLDLKPKNVEPIPEDFVPDFK